LTDADMAPDALDRLTDTLSGRIVAICAEGHGRSQGISAVLRIRGIAAEYPGGADAQPGVRPGCHRSIPVRSPPATGRAEASG
jgi:hypothetical protein